MAPKWTILLVALAATLPEVLGRGFGERIYYGQEAEPGEFPFAVQIELRLPAGSIYCTGSIVDERHILTAGHCTHDENETPMVIKPDQLTVYVGCHRFLDCSRNYTIERYESHKKNLPFDHFFDLAMLRTSEEIKFNNLVGLGAINRGRVAKAPQVDAHYDENLTLAGWGMTENGDRPNLMKATLQVVAEYECRTNGFPGAIPYHTICTRADNLWPCNGDSGSPLVRMYNGTQVVVGIHSGGHCKQGKPNIHVRLTHYSDWITNRILSWSGRWPPKRSNCARSEQRPDEQSGDFLLPDRNDHEDEF